MGDGGGPGEMFFVGGAWKGTAADFDETSEPLTVPCFVASRREEATYYAANLPADDDGLRRVLELAPVRPWKLILMDDTKRGQELLAGLGIPFGKPADVAMAVMAAGFDGIALDGRGSGLHVILNDARLIRHVETHPVAGPAPRP